MKCKTIVINLGVFTRSLVLDNQGHVDVINGDLAKIFDRIDHSINSVVNVNVVLTPCYTVKDLANNYLITD